MERRDKMTSAAGPGATSKNIEDRLTSARAPKLKPCTKLGPTCRDNRFPCPELIHCTINVTGKR
jgi:hypothetical protein